MQFIWNIFESEDEEDVKDFEIKEISFCDCFIDYVVFLKECNNKMTFRKFYDRFYYEIPIGFLSLKIYVYYAERTIVCCKESVYNPIIELDKDAMDKNCLAEKVDFCCLYFLSRETIFNCICDNCQKTLLKLVSKNFNKIKND